MMIARSFQIIQRRAPNHSIQRMGASHSGQGHVVYQRRLAPTADADRSATMQ